jgi:hypothetical protein
MQKLTPIQAAIERRAYSIWENEGRPPGRALEHWLRAEREILTESSTLEKVKVESRVGKGSRKRSSAIAAGKQTKPRA